MAMKACMEPSAVDMICDDPFDSIDDLLDFPNDDDVFAIVEACGGGAPLAPPQAPATSSAGSGGGVNAGAAAGGLHDRPAAISGGFKQENDALGLCNDIDIANLEWLSNFFEDSEFNFDFPATPAVSASTSIPSNKDDSLFRSSSPISVLEPNSLSGGTTTIGGRAYSSTTSSCSSSNSILDRSINARPPPPPAPIDMPVVPARARTKRPRPPSCSARSFVPPPSSEYPATISYPARPAEPESVGESYPVAMKKKKKKKEVVSESGEENSAEGAAALPVRKCMHCEIQKTPQWRAGPMGPKTLCNACGVRYKSGRLFPEYRPAASPNFVPSIHSNSHKKVVEMRLKSNQTAAGNVGMTPQEGTVAAKNCDLLKYIRRQDSDN